MDLVQIAAIKQKPSTIFDSSTFELQKSSNINFGRNTVGIQPQKTIHKKPKPINIPSE
jgi:hypothetical protein